MPHAAAARMATRGQGAICYQRHRPEQTLLYQIVEHLIVTHLIKKSGRTHRGAVTLIQTFGSALNLNIHFHMLFLDGV